MNILSQIDPFKFFELFTLCTLHEAKCGNLLWTDWSSLRIQLPLIT